MWRLFGQVLEKLGLLSSPTSGHTGYNFQGETKEWCLSKYQSKLEANLGRFDTKHVRKGVRLTMKRLNQDEHSTVMGFNPDCSHGIEDQKQFFPNVAMPLFNQFGGIKVDSNEWLDFNVAIKISVY